jgi:hypothetical protein
MSISAISSPLSTPIVASSAVGAQSGLLHASIGDISLKDKIDLSKEAVALLLGGGAVQPK